MVKNFAAHFKSLFAWGNHHARKTLVTLVIILLLPNLITLAMALPRWYSPSSAPARPIAVVFGAGLLPGGQPTPALEDRISSAAGLYLKGQVQSLLMSGERRSDLYDEPAAMQAYAIKLGVPRQAIILDGAGYHTYASCYRAKNEFQVHQAILVTTDYHLPRALFLCNALGIDSIGVASGWGSSLRGPNYFLGALREIPATFTAFKEAILGPEN
jgi:vancomycin permeability regulator SanA